MCPCVCLHTCVDDTTAGSTMCISILISTSNNVNRNNKLVCDSDVVSISFLSSFFPTGIG